MKERLGPAFEEVLAAAQNSAPWAFRRLYAAYAPAIAGYARAQGVPEPDEVVNDVFLGAFRTVAAFSGDEKAFRSWLFTIAHHRLVDARRRLARQRDVDGEERVGDAEDEALTRVATERVRQVLSRLAPAQRDVMLLRIIGDMTIEQVAAAMGKQPGAVKALQRRALGALRRQLEGETRPSLQVAEHRGQGGA